MFASKTPFGGGGFGTSTSAFGQQSTPFGGSSGGLFGNQTPAVGAFGTPSFGSTAPVSGGLFGGTSSSNSIFGAKTTQASTGFGFGNTGTGGGLFSGGTSSLFQTPQSNNNAFGTQSTGFGGFGTSTSAFGTSTAPTGGLFGGGGISVFGQTAVNGTTIKFVPVVSSEQTQKSGLSVSMKTLNQCITVMDQYKDKSVEELRLEDYIAGRKGGSTSAFGSTASSGGLFGSTTGSTGTSLFGTAATSKPSGFGGFGTGTSTGGLFGQSTGGLFGAKTTQSLFGSANTTTQSGFGGFGTSTGGLFGSTSNTGNSLFGNTTSAQSGGLFGTSGFGTNTTSGSLFAGTSAFGQAASSSSLFGTTSKPSFGFGTSSGTGFGTSNSMSFGSTTSGGLFGNTQSKPALSFGGFGTAAGTSGFGGFGTTTTSSTNSLFGNTSNSLFGNKPTGFGTTGFGTSTGTTGSLFGGSTLGTGNLGFGGFGTTQSTGLTMTGASLGGLSNVDQSTLAALRQQQIIQQQLKAIANTPFGDSPLFRNLTDSSKAKKTQSTTAFTSKEPVNTSQYKVFSRPAAKVKPRPIASPSLGKSRLFDGLEDEGDFSPHPVQPRRSVKKLVIKNKPEEDVESPCRISQVKFRSFNDMDDDLLAPSPEVVKTMEQLSTGQSKTPIFDNTIAELNAQEKTPKFQKTQNYVLTPKSIEEEKKSEITVEENGEELSKCQIILRRPEYFTIPSISVLDKQVVDDQCLVRDFTVGREGYGEVKFLGVTNVFGLNLDNIVSFRRREVEVYPDDYPNKPEVGMELNKPSEITLFKVWPNDKSFHTPVKSPERLKASGFIERLEEKTLAMNALFIDYRPKDGAWVFKVNHFTRYGMQQEEFISEVIDIEKRKQILREKVIQQGNIDFQKETSRADEEIQMKIKHKLSQLKDSLLRDEELSILQNKESIVEGDDKEEEEEEEMENSLMEDEDKENYVDPSFSESDAVDQVMSDEFIPMSHQLGRVARVKPFNLQGMKTSILYDDEDEQEVATPKTLIKSKQLFSNKSIFSNSFAHQAKQSPFLKLNISNKPQADQENLNSSVFQNITDETGFNHRQMKVQKKAHLFKNGLLPQKSFVDDQPEILQRKDNIIEDNLFIKCRSYGLVPYRQSLLYGKTYLLADAALLHSQEFHVRWLNGSTFIHAGQSVGNITTNTKRHTANIFTSALLHSPSPLGLIDNNIHVEQLEVTPDDGVKRYIKECLELSLKYSEFEDGNDTILKRIKWKSPVDSIAEFSQKLKLFKEAAVGLNVSMFEFHSDVWALVAALWGKQEIDETGTKYELHAARREALSEWLSKSLEKDIKQEIERNRLKNDGHLSVIFSLLSGNRVSAACDVARENKEIRLTFLLSQISGDHHLKHYMRNQLEQWDERNVDMFIHHARLKLYTLLSGMMVWKSTHSHINICEDLSWKRCLALHLWYYCSSTATIFDAFTEYQSSFKGTETYNAYSTFPSPPYESLNEKNKTKDLCYHLLALYCKRSHSLEKLLTPKSHTSNPLDYHLSWHLQQVLDELGYNHMSDERHAFLQHNYAAQLESLGLWHWAIFVLMHLRDDSRREFYVKDLLNRYCHVNEEGSVDLTKEEELLINKFHVPLQWLHEAKALHAKYNGDYLAETVHLLRAGLWDKAHEVVLERLAADAIVDEDYGNLKDLLQDISLPERCCIVKNWRIGGQIFLDFILLKEKLESIKSHKSTMNSYHLEDMETEISSLINRITLMKVETSRERLAQSEMARTCSNMLKIVFSLLSSDNDDLDDMNPKWPSMKVVPYVVELPLPPDYYLKELRELLSNFANEVEFKENT